MYKLGWFYLFQVMTNMNKVMDPVKTAQTMQEFERQSAKMGMTEDMSMYFCTQICLG